MFVCVCVAGSRDGMEVYSRSVCERALVHYNIIVMMIIILFPYYLRRFDGLLVFGSLISQSTNRFTVGSVSCCCSNDSYNDNSNNNDNNDNNNKSNNNNKNKNKNNNSKKCEDVNI